MINSLLLDFPVESSTDKISIKIADFGLARSEVLTQSAKMTGFMGTFVTQPHFAFNHTFLALDGSRDIPKQALHQKGRCLLICGSLNFLIK